VDVVAASGELAAQRDDREGVSGIAERAEQEPPRSYAISSKISAS
jgi:hypothetical protein